MKNFAAVISLSLLALPTASRAAEARLSGRVTAEARVTGPRDGGAYASRSLNHAVLFDYTSLKNAVVYAERADTAPEPPPAPPAAMRVMKWSRGIILDPALIFVTVGSSLTVSNETDQEEGVCTGGDSPAPFMISVPAKGRTETRLGGIGLYQIFSLEDPGSRADVFVTGPYFGRVDDKGRYSFSLPPGRYRVTAWHKRLPPQTNELELREGENRSLDFVLSVKDLPEVK